jgi:Type II secretion system (T2SS), protein E, N-terminal domain
MPFLDMDSFSSELASQQPARVKKVTASLFPECGNPLCESGRLHLWRNRAVPVFEGRWACSEECTKAIITSALVREFHGARPAPQQHRHRLPLGLLLLSQGVITQEQLKTSLEAQKAAGNGKLGTWLMRQHGIKESVITRALGIQWGCPVFNVEGHQSDLIAPIMPRLLVEAFGILPLRVAAGQILYVAFEDRVDPCLTLGLERMTKLRVEPGLLNGSEFEPIYRRMLNANYPKVRLIEVPDGTALTGVLTRIVEAEKPQQTRITRIHDCIWMRMWKRLDSGPIPRRDCVEDVVCSFGRAN